MVVTDGQPIKPNKIADTYQAFTEYHLLVSRLADANEEITGESESTLRIFSNLIGEKRAEFGKATSARNSFTMEEYRKKFSNELPTITTKGLSPSEREPLEGLGIIEHDEAFRLPCRPNTDDRVHIWPISGGLNPDYDMLQEFSVPQRSRTLFHISDTHLGYRNRKKPGGGGNTKWVDRVDSIRAFQAVLQQAVDENVDAVVHTGDLFDHDVNQDTLGKALSAIEALAEHGIPFYFILGDHDRLATGGEIPFPADAVSALKSVTESGAAIHLSTTPTNQGGSPVTLFGVDATDVGFAEIQEGYTLDGWSPSNLEFRKAEMSGPNILCLHEPLRTLEISRIIEAAEQQGNPLDLILLGHEHSPPFDGEWQTTVEGVTVAYAGPTIPISAFFDENVPGYNRIRVGANGNLGVDRRELTLNDSASTV